MSHSLVMETLAMPRHPLLWYKISRDAPEKLLLPRGHRWHQVTRMTI